MLIANPIYDSVFKYLMDDNKVARLLLSAIMGEEIIALKYRPTEFRGDLQPQLTVCSIDFSATILNAAGEKRLVILEIQKAKYATDIMRFRRYLGAEYSNPANVMTVQEPQTEYHKKPLPIVSIYFLGYKLDVVKAPVVKVQREYRDVTTGHLIREKEEFIEWLTHDSYIIQIPYLQKKRQTELLQALSVFDQSNRSEDYHILNVKEEALPERYRPLIRRLLMAMAEPEVRQKMTTEDIYMEQLQDIERTIKAKDKIIEGRDQALAEKDKAMEEKDKAMAQALAEKDKIIEELKKRLTQNR